MQKDVYLKGKKVVSATVFRVPPEERKEGIHYYDIRHADDCGFTPAMIENFVFINHMATIGLDSPLDFNECGYLLFDEDEEDIILSVL